MGQVKGKRGRGRPRIEFDLKSVEGLGKLGATYEEMAAFFGVDYDTIQSRMQAGGDFFLSYQKGLGDMRRSLRRRQIEAALDGNPTMLIWLGKQQLGQVDRQESRVVDLASMTDEQVAALVEKGIIS